MLRLVISLLLPHYQADCDYRHYSVENQIWLPLAQFLPLD